MDPDANLKEQRILALRMTSDHDDPESNGIDQDDANRLAELVLALDEWIKNGGFLPKAWSPR